MTKKEFEKNTKIYCTMCGKEKSLRSFYASKQGIHNNGIYHKKYPICKKCIKDRIYDKETKKIDKKEFKKMLEQLNLPFDKEVYKRALEGKKETFGAYISILNFHNLGTANSGDNNTKINNNNEEIEITQDLINKWGKGYEDNEYLAFEKKYDFLVNNYSEKTNMHKEALMTYVRYKVKEEMATAKNDVDDAKKWADMANKAATNAKINPSQLSKADLSDGLSTFSELSQAVESEVDIIRILPRFKCRPNDALDFNIWCYVNYERDLAGLPPCKYEDIYKFYDKRIKEYVEQYGDPYGIFSDDTSKKNRKNIEKFITEEDKGDTK